MLEMWHHWARLRELRDLSDESSKRARKQQAIGPFWRFYGGKWRAAPRYPVPQLRTIVEPFAGAAGYACRYPHLDVVLVDRDPIIAGIWRYLIAVKPAEVLTIPDIPEGGTVDDLSVCQEARWLAGFWCNNGTTQPSKSPSKWSRECGQESHNWSGWGYKPRQRIARDVQRIRHWRIIEGEYHDAPDIEATWFIDPPYQTAAGRHYKHQPGDFAALGKWVQGRQGQVIACDQQGADWLPWTTAKVLAGTPGKHRSGKSEEVVYHRSTGDTP